MLQRPTFRSTWLPLALAAGALVVLNLGLYTRLKLQPIAPRYQMPYYEDFTTMTDMPYEKFGGDWEIRDQALVQLSTSGWDLTSFIPILIAPDQPYAFGATLRFLGGSMGGGLIFNAQQTTSRQKSHMVRFNVDGGQLWLIYGYFGNDSDFIGQGSILLNFPPDNADPHRLRVQTTEGSYALYLDEALVVQDVPLEYSGGAVGFISATSQVAFDEVAVEAVAPDVAVQAPVDQPPTDAPAPVVEATTIPADAAATTEQTIFADGFDNAAGGESLWRPISGDWVYADSALIQQQVDGFDFSTIYQQPLPYPLTMQTTFTHRQGVGGGLLFNLSGGDSKNGGHMVRYVDAGDVIAWGYFDADGVFNGQGSAPVTVPGATAHTLAVRVDGTTYAILLDGVELASSVQIANPVTAGYIGLTASQSVVAFTDVQVSTTVAGSKTVTAPETSTANIDAAAASGTWLVEGSIITQTDTELTDYIAGTGLAGEQFTISVTISMPPENPDAGAGIMFHAEGRDDRRLGHMVRFGSGGQELFWGRYDPDGNFIGDGGIPLTLAAAESHTLRLVVRAGSFDIQVDGVMVVEAIPIERTRGWIGLVSFSGPVTFANVSVQLGQ